MEEKTMKKSMHFISGALAATIVLLASMSALAASGVITIEASPINVLVNGTVFEPKDPSGNPALVFVYNGTTYAPLRALAEAYGLEVGYDSAKNLATVSKPGAVSAAQTPDVVITAAPEQNLGGNEMQNSTEGESQNLGENVSQNSGSKWGEPARHGSEQPIMSQDYYGEYINGYIIDGEEWYNAAWIARLYLPRGYGFIVNKERTKLIFIRIDYNTKTDEVIYECDFSEGVVFLFGDLMHVNRNWFVNTILPLVGEPITPPEFLD
jgi:hypothetical protein